MSILKPTDLGKIYEKTAKEINQILEEIGFIENCDKGWKLTEKGQQNGGMQKNYMGRLSVYWKDEIKDNAIFSGAVKPTESKDEREIDFRTKFKATYRTVSGHYVRSRAEVIIADWLYREYIGFAYEKRVPIKEDMFCDFYLPKERVYIEFWGYEEDKVYLDRKNKKLQLYRENNLNLIEIDNKTINNIDDFLPRELLKFKK